MSAQGGTARTKAASGNGQQPKKPAQTEIFKPVDESQDTSPAQGRPLPTQEDNQPSTQSVPPQGPPQPPPESNDTVRIRPSLATEAPPPLVELPSKKKSK